MHDSVAMDLAEITAQLTGTSIARWDPIERREGGSITPLVQPINSFVWTDLDIDTGCFQLDRNVNMKAWAMNVYSDGIIMCFAGVGPTSSGDPPLVLPNDTFSLPSLLPATSGGAPMTVLPFNSVLLNVTPDPPKTVTSYTDVRPTLSRPHALMSNLNNIMVGLGGRQGDVMDFVVTSFSAEFVANVRYDSNNNTILMRNGSSATPYYVCNYTLADLQASSFRLTNRTQPIELSNSTNLFTERFVVRNPVDAVPRLKLDSVVYNSAEIAGGMLGGLGQALGTMAGRKHEKQMQANTFAQQEKMANQFFNHKFGMQELQNRHQLGMQDIQNAFTAGESEKNRQQQSRMQNTQHAHEMSTTMGMQKTNRLY